MNKNLALRLVASRKSQKVIAEKNRITAEENQWRKENLRSWWTSSSSRSAQELMALTPAERGTPGEMYQPGFVYRGKLDDLPAGWHAYDSPDPSLGLTDYYCVHWQGVLNEPTFTSGSETDKYLHCDGPVIGVRK